jgi:Fic family protein
VEGALQALHDAESVIAMLRRKEAVASCQLEGVQASLLNLMDAEAGISPAGAARDVAEIQALAGVLADKCTGPTLQVLQQAHAQLVKGMGKRATGLRQSQTWVGAAGATLAEASFVPPHPNDIPALLEDWQSFLNADDKLHPLVKLALAYAQFECIHPFLDANGRIARAFMLMQLGTSGLLASGTVLWSQQLRRERQIAQRALHALRTQGEVEPWVQFFVGAIRRAALETSDIIRRVVGLREQHRADVAAEFGRVVPHALRIVDALIASPVIGIKDIIELTGTSFPAANELAQRLVKIGVLAEITGQARNRRFRYAPYVRIFIDDEGY